MTQEELEIAKAACCVGTIWGEYEGKESFDHMVGLRVKHLIELVRKYQPSLPSNLDEAAEEIASDIAPTYPDVGWDECFEKIKEGIKAGAEWREAQIPVSSDMRDAADEYSATPDNKRPVDGEKYKAFIAGAEWMAGQGETHELTVESLVLGPPMICCPVHADNGDKVVVQIRNK